MRLEWGNYNNKYGSDGYEGGKAIGFSLEENLLIKIYVGNRLLEKPEIILDSPNWQNKVEKLILSLIKENKHSWSG